MKKNILIILLSHFLIFSFSQFLSAQCPVKNTAFQDGERLDYKLYFNWKFIWKTAGTATLTTKQTTHQGQSAFQTDLITRTSGRIDRWFTMRDTLRSVFTPQVVPLFYRKGANEGGKYRFNDLDLGTVAGLPRILDMGQCNDAFGAVQVAVALAKAFGCGVNDLPLSIVLSWYEQKAVCVLLTLLYLGIKNIRLGPTLPAFVSPNVLNYLVEHYNIAPTGTAEADLKAIVG